MDPVLETERLFLRPWTLDDVPQLLRIFSDPEAMSFYPAPYDVAGTRRWIELQLEAYERDGHGLWASFEKDTGDFVGQCGIWRHPVGDAIEDEIGYHTLRAKWRRGFASEAAIGCRDYGFRVLGKERLVSWMRAEHVASRGVAEKAGMALERNTRHHRGYNMVVYAISRVARSASASLTRRVTHVSSARSRTSLARMTPLWSMT